VTSFAGKYGLVSIKIALPLVAVMKIVPAVEETPFVAEVVNIVSLTSTAVPSSVSGTRNTDFALLDRARR